MFESVKWIFFDLGSTLVDEQQVYSHIFRDMAAQTKLDERYLRNEAVQLFSQGKKGDVELCKRYGLPKRQWFLQDEALYEATPRCLEALRPKYNLGILANQPFGTVERLKKWGILEYFGIVIASAEEGISKPDPEIFHLALSRAGCNPENALMVGDRIDNDILPAKQVGMHTIWVRQGFGGFWERKDEAEQADCVVNNLLEICNYLV